jgi:ABC-type amino acid transport substrate-binding protein
MVMSKTLFAALSIILFTTSLFASHQNLRVGVAGQPPFLNMESVPSGAAVDIWEKIAAENGWGFSYTRFDTVKNGLKAIADGSLDILVGDTPINKENLAQAEFSQPFFHSGLQILIADNQRTVQARLANDIKDLVKLEIFWIIFACIVVLSKTVYLFERKHNPEFPTGRREGLAEAFYYVVTLALTGKSAYKGFPGVLGRMVLIIWILLGIISVAYVTSSITSAMTVEKLSNSVESLRDLNNKKIAFILLVLLIVDINSLPLLFMFLLERSLFILFDPITNFKFVFIDCLFQFKNFFLLFSFIIFVIIHIFFIIIFT